MLTTEALSEKGQSIDNRHATNKTRHTRTNNNTQYRKYMKQMRNTDPQKFRWLQVQPGHTRNQTIGFKSPLDLPYIHVFDWLITIDWSIDWLIDWHLVTNVSCIIRTKTNSTKQNGIPLNMGKSLGPFYMAAIVTSIIDP